MTDAGLDMAFPDSPRVLYAKNLLYEVSSQLRFPAVLKIDSQPPADFQEAIRQDFPYYAREVVQPQQAAPTAKQSGNQISINFGVPGQPYHLFTSADKNTYFRLTNNDLGLFCRRYERWEAFRSHLSNAFNALTRVYRPAFFSHVCVRYKNAVVKSAVGMAGEPWRELLSPWLLGPLSDSDLGEGVRTLQSTCGFVMPGDIGKVDVGFGLGYHPGAKEPAFLIESHVFADGQTRAEDVFQRLEVFRRTAGCFFRTCITDRLHRAMGPTPLGAADVPALG